MKPLRLSLVAGLVLVLGAAQTAQAETKVKLSEMHLCCGACVKAVQAAVAKVEGATVEVDKDAGAAVVTGADVKTVRKAINSIANAGFHAKSDHEKLAMRNNSGAKAGKVERIELTGVHNCCGGCNAAIKKAVATVVGVAADTAKAKQTSFVVEGEFDAMALVTALNKAGFHVKVKP